MYTGERRVCGTRQSIGSMENTRKNVSVFDSRDRWTLEINTARDLLLGSGLVSTRQAKHDVGHDAAEHVESGAAEMLTLEDFASREHQPSSQRQAPARPSSKTRRLVT